MPLVRWLWLVVVVALAQVGCQVDADPLPTSTTGCRSDAECPAGGPCTAPSCVQGACAVVAAAEGQPCASGGHCVAGQICSAGACQGGTERTCDDGIACTTDGCDPATGCWFVAASSACDDANPCTTDTCSASGCLHQPTSAPCNDGDSCTVGDTCSAGVCRGESGDHCNDGSVCTTDSCDAELGCVHVFNQAPCDDGDPQTVQDTCFEGHCDGK